MVDVEALFFKKSFQGLYSGLKPIIANKNWANDKLRTLPLQFILSMLEQVPSVAKEVKVPLLTDLLQLVFKVMVDVDPVIDEDWLNPSDGHINQEGDDEEDVSFTSFGMYVIDRLIMCQGE